MCNSYRNLSIKQFTLSQSLVLTNYLLLIIIYYSIVMRWLSFIIFTYYILIIPFPNCSFPWWLTVKNLTYSKLQISWPYMTYSISNPSILTECARVYVYWSCTIAGTDFRCTSPFLISSSSSRIPLVCATQCLAPGNVVLPYAYVHELCPSGLLVKTAMLFSHPAGDYQCCMHIISPSYISYSINM